MKRGVLFLIFVILCACTYKKANSQEATKETFSLEKIVFHTYRCFGDCPTYHLEIDSSRNTRLFAERVYTANGEIIYDKAKEGYFSGKIDEANYQKLESLIKSVGVDTLNFGKAECCDGSLKKIIVYYNGKRKFMKSMFPPKFTFPMIEQLRSICINHNLKRVNEKFEIEETKK
jgi:hypothetical protein